MTFEVRIRLPGHRVQRGQPGQPAADQDPGDRAGRHAQLGAQPGRPTTFLATQLDDPVLGLDRRALGAGVRAAGPVDQPCLTLSLEAKRAIQVRTHFREIPIAAAIWACRHPANQRATISFRP